MKTTAKMIQTHQRNDKIYITTIRYRMMTGRKSSVNSHRIATTTPQGSMRGMASFHFFNVNSNN